MQPGTGVAHVFRFEGTSEMDKEALESRLKSNRWRQQKSQPINWKPYYCVLLQDDRSFTHFPTEEMSIGERLFLELPRVRLDGGRQAFRRRWGYDMGVPSVPEEDEDSSELSETTSLRDERLLRFSSMDLGYIIPGHWISPKVKIQSYLVRVFNFPFLLQTEANLSSRMRRPRDWSVERSEHPQLLEGFSGCWRLRNDRDEW
ncbi:Ras GTPase-activating protein raskol like protein [Argiope bruennichi]|uniref:Ras GTPase-activating protein raskol like protein n=1 Tax=Argiope bruennichi TaxID=94029 RepID=A0A8T0EHW3_ARGBR|nr:Ras GTPase-activating protein raskol like protein [Argiope bruennichi]